MANNEPKDAEGWRLLGDEYITQEKYDEALAAYTKAIELEPNFARAFSNRAIVYELQGKLNDALVDYSRAIELNPTGQLPEEGYYYYRRAGLYNIMKKYDLAKANYTKAMYLNPWYSHPLPVFAHLMKKR
jgi:tetratricopeptide (TPR) repeat protein